QMQRAIAASTFNPSDSLWREKIIARSQLMEDRLAIANRAAGCDVPVLLTGENGTGKELLARAIHAASTRRNQIFLALSCGDLSRAQLASQLFGTGNQPSAFQRALDGTLLLGEIGELSFDLQVALARAIASQGSPATVMSRRPPTP